MSAIAVQVAQTEADLFKTLNIPRRKIELSEQHVCVELHPTTSGPMAALGKSPVLLARKVLVTLEPDAGSVSGARIVADIVVDSLEVVSPDIAEGDRLKIASKVHSTLLQSEFFPRIRFESKEVSVSSDGKAIMAKGTLTIRGGSVEQFLRFKRIRPSEYEANVEIKQTAFGLKPLSALMGALRSDDRLKIRCQVSLETRE